jgi:hypothetical protein
MRTAAFLALLLLAAGNAFAHGGHGHDESAPAAGASALPQVTSQASAPCAPDGSHVCACGNLVLCSGAGKQAAIAAAFADFILVAAPRSPQGRSTPQPSSPPTYRTLARAPPLFSLITR